MLILVTTTYTVYNYIVYVYDIIDHGLLPQVTNPIASPFVVLQHNFTTNGFITFI